MLYKYAKICLCINFYNRLKSWRISTDSAVNDYPGFVLYQPIINGIGGNLVSVQSSRISTMLHKTSVLGSLPPFTKQWVAPWTALFKGGNELL